MTIINLLPAGLIVIAMLTTSAVAHENFIAGRHGRHVVLKGNTNAYSTTVRWIYSHTRIPGESGTAPQPGGICDHGDNPQIC